MHTKVYIVYTVVYMYTYSDSLGIHKFSKKLNDGCFYFMTFARGKNVIESIVQVYRLYYLKVRCPLEFKIQNPFR